VSLELQRNSTNHGLVRFSILNQCKLAYTFVHANTFIASNGMKICSTRRPEVRLNILFIRGTDAANDNDQLECSVDHFSRIMRAVADFNAKLCLMTIAKLDVRKSVIFND